MAWPRRGRQRHAACPPEVSLLELRQPAHWVGADVALRRDGAEPHLLMQARRPHAPAMFVVTEVDAAAIRAAYERRGELSAAVELRRRFPGITDNLQAQEYARIIADWRPLVVPLRPARRPNMTP